jgi:hypothetical protein
MVMEGYFRPTTGRTSAGRSLKGAPMKIHLKMLGSQRDAIVRDLLRPHEHAAERVGFVSCRFGNSESSLMVLAHTFHPVLDENYEFDPGVGARMNSAAIRSALQVALSNDVGMFHVHLHDHRGLPGPSGVDWTEWQKFVPNFWHVRPQLPHGALILSRDRLSGWCWYPKRQQPIPIERFSIVGRGMRSWSTVK